MVSKKSKSKNVMISRERYHGPLIANGVSLGYIKIYPWINLPFTIFAFLAGGYNDYVGIIKRIFLVCIIINIISILVSFFHSFMNRFKSLSYLLIALVTWTTLMWLNFIGLMLFISDGSPISAKNFYDSSLTLFYIIPILLLFIIFCGIYAWYYLPKNHGKRWKINDTRGKKNAFANNFWIAFGAVTIIPSLLTGYLQNAFGLFLGILMTTTLTAVIVDALYAAIYIRKHPKYDGL